ncbi:hypothetical protein NYR55_14260 [Sphingomonas sp. BGYR3]|uniref:hypothetical protein n=1 Tax=Sphingomonas sp. BGYR3 TaxID=2975483 RepID=UPI0021A42A80|nr:hypothetical protein [Sphingomonas sp. BGYR3]
MKPAKAAIPALFVLAAVLAGCSRTGELDVGQGVGVSAVRSACPTTGVVAGAGDITLFDPAGSQDANAIDMTAVITNVRAQCGTVNGEIVSQLTFDILARRTRTDAARTVTVPYFVTVLRGGSQVVSKRVAEATLTFAAGEPRAQARGQGTAVVNLSAATLPEEVRQQLTRRRRAGDEDAAVDPLSQPEVRDAVRAATFEALVGFQLTEAQLAYNVTR